MDRDESTGKKSEKEQEKRDEDHPFSDDTKMLQMPPGGPICGSSDEKWMICSECGYRRKLRDKAQVLFCKHCKKRLVPEDASGNPS